jgi:hypothetical protein
MRAGGGETRPLGESHHQLDRLFGARSHDPVRRPVPDILRWPLSKGRATRVLGSAARLASQLPRVHDTRITTNSHWDPHGALPVQFYPARARSAEHRLMLAVLEDALEIHKTRICQSGVTGSWQTRRSGGSSPIMMANGRSLSSTCVRPSGSGSAPNS